MYIIFLAQILATFFMLGLIWFVQIVHYPLLASIPQEIFSNYETRNVFLTTVVVGLPMLTELITAWLLIWKRTPLISRKVLWINFVVLVIIWLTSFSMQVPIHIQLMQAFDPAAHHYLVYSNWIRTILWSIRAILLSFILYRLLNIVPKGSFTKK